MFKNNKIYNQDLITKSEKKTFENKDSFSVMQIAAKACSKYILSNYKLKRVLILCGPGNNGGDGILIAKDLLEQKCHVSIFAPIGYGKTKDSAKALTKLNNNDLFKKSIDYRDFDFFIDALFGFNFNRQLPHDLKEILIDINSQKFFKISIDVPSGVYCDNGQIDEIAIQADLTLTFHRLKPAHVLLPGKEFSKKIEILEIGLTNIDSDTNVSIIDKPIINPPAINEHKYNRGELYIFASNEMWPFVWSLDQNFYFRPESGGLLFSVCDEEVSGELEPTVNPDISQAIVNLVWEQLPALRETAQRHVWSCFRTISADGSFVIGWDYKVDRFFWVAALSGHGMGGSWGIGKLAAQQFMEPGSSGPHPCDPIRFAEADNS